ncbi:hypothetical protein HDU93_003716 [Gonapodya sp. JEL0774]|nr:hypothetical protein HDU93_003716 [Gonapodya sp. JEL0774]
MEVYSQRSRENGYGTGYQTGAVESSPAGYPAYQSSYPSYQYSLPSNSAGSYSSRAASPAKSNPDSAVAIPRTSKYSTGTGKSSESRLSKEGKTGRTQKYGNSPPHGADSPSGRATSPILNRYGTSQQQQHPSSRTRASNSGFESMYYSSPDASARNSRASREEIKETYAIPISDEKSDDEYVPPNPYLNKKPQTSTPSRSSYDGPQQYQPYESVTGKSTTTSATTANHPMSTTTLSAPSAPTSSFFQTAILSQTAPTLFAVTIFAYQAERADELTISDGEIVRVQKTPEGGWWYGTVEVYGSGDENTDSSATTARRMSSKQPPRRGWFPANHTAYIADLPDEKPTFTEDELEALRQRPNSDETGLHALMNSQHPESIGNNGLSGVQTTDPAAVVTSSSFSQNPMGSSATPFAPSPQPQFAPPVAASAIKPDEILYRTLLSQIPGLAMNTLDSYGSLVNCEKNCSVSVEGQSQPQSSSYAHKSSKAQGSSESIEIFSAQYDPAVVFLLERAVVVVAPEGAMKDNTSNNSATPELWGKLKKSKTIGHLPNADGRKSGGAGSFSSAWSLVEVVPLYKDLVEVWEQDGQPAGRGGLFGLGSKAPTASAFALRYAMVADNGVVKAVRKVVITMAGLPGAKFRSEERVRTWVQDVNLLIERSAPQTSTPGLRDSDAARSVEGAFSFGPEPSVHSRRPSGGAASPINRGSSGPKAPPYSNNMQGSMSFDGRPPAPSEYVAPLRGASVDVRRAASQGAQDGRDGTASSVKRPMTFFTFQASGTDVDKEQDSLVSRKSTDGRRDRMTKTVENLLKTVVGYEQREPREQRDSERASKPDRTTGVFRRLSRKNTDKSVDPGRDSANHSRSVSNGQGENGWTTYTPTQRKESGGMTTAATGERARSTMQYTTAESQMSPFATSASAPGGLVDMASSNSPYGLSDGADIMQSPPSNVAYSSPGVIVMRRSSREVNTEDWSDTEREYLDLLQRRRDIDARLKELEGLMLRSKMLVR